MNNIDNLVLNRVSALTETERLHLTKLGQNFKKLPKGIQREVFEIAVRMREVGMKTRSNAEAEKETIWEVLKNAAKTMYSSLPEH